MRQLPATLLLLAAARFAAADESVFPCDTTDGFQSAKLDGGGKPDGAELTAKDGNLVLSYERAKMAPLAHIVGLTEFAELRLLVRSDAEAIFAVALKDRDGATFHCPVKLEAGKWETVSLTPERFVPNADSAVKKTRLDPARLGWGWVLIDAGALSGAAGRNTLRVDEVRVVRQPFEESSGEWAVDGDQTIAASRRHRGTLVVRAGARLRVTAPRFVLDGDLRVEGGSLEFAGGLVEVPQRFNHEREFRLSGRASLVFREALVVTRVPASLKLSGEPRVEWTGAECMGGFTCDVPEKAHVVISKSSSPGEFIVTPGGTVDVADSQNVILWLFLGPALKGTLRLPAPDVGDPWRSGTGLNVTVARSTGIRWCLVSSPGSDGAVQGEATAAGLLFGGKTALTLDDLQDGRAFAEWALPAPDRKLVFRDGKVGAWNLYASDDSRVTLRKSTFGEAMTFGHGRIEVEDSTCDGKGGYLAAHDDGELRLTRCRISCLVVARHRGTVVLADCDVTGDVRATEKGTVRLVRTRVTGTVEADPGARLTRE